MTDWNRDYLSAMGVPVWVPRQSQPVDKKEEKDSVQDSVSDDSVSENHATDNHNANEVLKMVAISGKQEQPFAIIIDEKSNINPAKQAFQQLQYAWQQWTSVELPVALYQCCSQQMPKQAVSVAEFQGTLIISETFAQQLKLSKQLSDAPDTKLLLAPELSFTENTAENRKKWWETLQQIAGQTSH